MSLLATEPSEPDLEADGDAPLVSIIIPMLDERGFIGPCIDGFLAQRYPADRMEVLVVDGGSTDGSREEAETVALRDPRVRVVDNPRRVAAAAANVGIEHARGEVLCFLSAHGEPDADYVATSVRALREGGVVGVGGRYRHEGTDRRSRAIGVAMASPFGMASPHRTAERAMDVDTISHPTFRRDALLAVGGYDEGLLANEDYELNHRLRAAGGRLRFCPDIASVYRPRRSLGALARQFHAYGRGKAAVAVRHPASVRPRHLVPPAAVLALAIVPLALRTRPGAAAVAVGALGYGAVLGAAVRHHRDDLADAELATFLAAFPVMHAAWGSGVLRGLVAHVGPHRA